MATIGSLNVMLKANAMPLVNGLTQSAKAVKGLGGNFTALRGNTEPLSRSMEKSSTAVGGLREKLLGLASPISAVGGLLAGLAAGAVTALAAMFVKAARGVAGIADLGRRTNTSVTALMGMQHAMRALGGEAATIDKAVMHFNEILSGMGTDANVARLALGSFGLALDEMAGQDTSEGIKKIADAFVSTADPIRKSTLAIAAFGSEAGPMTRFLSEGSAGIQKLVDNALHMGYALNQIDATALEKSAADLNQVQDLLTGITRTQAAGLADTFNKVAEGIVSIANKMESVSSIVAKVFRSIEIGWELVRLGADTVIASALIGFTKMFQYLTKGLSNIFNLLAKLPESMGGDMFKGIATSLQNTSSAAEGFADNLRDVFMEDMRGLANDIRKGFDGIGRTVEQKKNLFDLEKKLNAGGAVNAISRFDKAIQDGIHKIEAAKSPLQDYNDQLKSFNLGLRGLLGKGNDEEVLNRYSRGVAGLINNLEKAHSLGEVKLAGGLQRGTAAATSAINRSESLNNGKLREKPEDRVRRVLEQSQEIEREQLTQLRRIGDAIRPTQAVKF